MIREATGQDAEAMCALINRIIAIGGTTAHQAPYTPEAIATYYIDGETTVTCVVAEVDGAVIGWQAIGWWQGEPHIGSFVAADTQAKGVGAQMFALTRKLAHKAGLTEIHASIRADNVPGLAYYARMGFADYGHDPDFALADGRVVGRVLRRFDLA